MKQKPKSKEEVYTFVRMAAEHHGWVVSPDTQFVEILVDGLQENFNTYGYFLCPCRDGEGSRKADRDIVCPCVYSKPDIDEYGHCYCGLYLDPDFAASGRLPEPIPERRPD
ncbi:MAG: ferredoxin:thioredoxin reductase [Spirochaetales bacterium]|nr:ferredoxin:thioredoxin reductase [Spirochaetales bacterium]MCF7938087.1 ferredoxin:thioredoxin reductase [Spirochaetales bacterium]